MRSSLANDRAIYIGADLTDRYAARCRDVDVCGLAVEDHGLRAIFWRWEWDRPPQSLQVSEIARELRGTRAAMLDGPHAMAAEGSTLRVCERQCAAAGKTPDRLPELHLPFGGFIRSSIELFAALRSEGVAVSPPEFVEGVSEIYPGHVWTLLAGKRLARKSTREGRLERRRILGALGVTALPDLPTHDQNDAAVSALLAAAADGQIEGLSVASIGQALSVDGSGTMREGPMPIPVLNEALAIRIAASQRGR